MKCTSTRFQVQEKLLTVKPNKKGKITYHTKKTVPKKSYPNNYFTQEFDNNLASDERHSKIMADLVYMKREQCRISSRRSKEQIEWVMMVCTLLGAVQQETVEDSVVKSVVQLEQVQ